MLRFFQRYQRFFFLFVTVLIIGSFAFFGVLDTLINRQRDAEDFTVGKLIDGSPMMHSDVQRLARFIATDREDLSLSSHGVPNLCNDGVIRNDILRTGLSECLVSSYFESFKEDLQQKLDKAKKYRGYEHPEAAFISARLVWDRMAPSLIREWESLRSEEEVSVSTFSHLSHLYQQQAACPPELLRRILMYYHSQASWVKPDPHLQYADLSLFGYHSVSDWFGSHFVDSVAQFILNGAKYAEQKGYRVTLEEAKSDLLCHFRESMKKLSDVKPLANLTFHQHLQSLGFDENSAAQAWRSVLLFRRYFHGVGQATFLDRLPYREFASFARETASIQKYEWPQALCLRSFEDLVAFQVYVQSISPDKGLSLPSTFFDVETVAKQTPELVLTQYRMEVAEAKVEEVGLRASFKEVLDWQIEDQNWEELSRKFPFVQNVRSKEDRCARIEELSSENRAKIDLYSRSQLVRKHPEWIAEYWHFAKPVEKRVYVGSNWISLPGIASPWILGALMEDAALGQEESKCLLENYTEEGNLFYRFAKIEKVEDRHIATFEEAKRLGLIADIANRYLESEYKKLRVKTPSRFQLKEGEWKPLSSVKEEIASIVFADLLKSITLENMPLAYYASHRLEVPAKEALASLQRNSDHSKWLPKGVNSIEDQFKLVKTESAIQRNDKDEWMKEQVLILMENEWSPVHVPDDGKISFFYLEKKIPHDEPILEQISFGKEVIAADAQRYAAEALLSQIKSKNSIIIPMQKDRQ